jgi:hypothetical protein
MLQDTFSIEGLFNKNIHRDINGVVQAGQRDEKTIDSELDEYVMTKEIKENLDYFYKNYSQSLNEPTTKMGVWISGFFGSGKSHFLKILSYLLNNEVVYGKRAVDYFKEKAVSEKLLAMMQEVSEYDSHALLFNIDSKASGNKKSKEMIVEVFLKVFNEHLGFSSTLWIADIERQLDDEGIYDEFKKAFEEIEGTPWEDSRAKIKLKRKAFVKALEKVGVDEETSKGLLTTANKTFEISSDEFAKLVKKYCDRHGDQYRLAFLVDEVGQYIGDDDHLMLNLQTVVEDLGNHCAGKVWVLVTSQEQIDAVTRFKGSDNFSKIQGRFATRINLSSSNTDEVIKRRLLEKTGPAADELTIQYEQQAQSLQNMLSFEPGKATLQSGYRSADDFVQIYPFVPYQVELLQRVFNKVRKQGEAGKHLAHGERSLLNAFQEVAKELSGEGTDRLARFSQFYETVKRFLDTAIVSTINNAKNREAIQDFDLDVLKALYMIKGIDEIRGTVENITTLLIDSVDCIKNELQKDIIRSLNRLKNAMLISENADKTFVFLSDDEQEINREIQRVDVNDANITEELGKVFFEEIYQQSRYRYQKTHDFEFNKRFGDYMRGAMIHPLTLQVFTGEVTLEQARANAVSGTLIMRLPEEYTAKFEEPIRYAEQIYAYANKKESLSLTERQKRIIAERRNQINEFQKKGREALIEACEEATFFIQGQDRTFSGSVENQLNSAFEILVKNTFGKLVYIDEPVPVKNATGTIKEWATDGLKSRLDGTFINHLAFDEVKRYLEEQDNFNTIVTMKSLVDRFKGMPYGWSENDIAGITAALLKAGHVKLVYASEEFDPSHPQFINRLTKTTEREKVVVKPKMGMRPADRRDVTNILREQFSQYEVGETYDDAAQLIREVVGDKLLQPITEINARRLRQAEQFPYPGGMNILKLKQEIEDLLSIRSSEKLVAELVELDEDIEEWLGEIEDYKSFYLGKAIEHFDESVRLLRERTDDIEVTRNDPSIQELKREIQTVLAMENPYNRIPKLPQYNQKLKDQLTDFVKSELHKHLREIKNIEMKMVEIQERYDLEIIKDLVGKERQVLEQRVDQLQNTESISKVYSYTQLVHNDFRLLNDKIREVLEEINLPPVEKKEKVLSPNELIQLVSKGNETVIDSKDDLDHVINSLKHELQGLLEINKIIIRK